MYSINLYMGALSHINQYFWKYKWLLVLGVIFTLFSNFFGVFPAQLVRYALDLVTETIDIYFLFKGFTLQTAFYEIFGFTLFFYGGLIILMAIMKGVFLFLVRQTLIVMSRHIEYELKKENADFQIPVKANDKYSKVFYSRDQCYPRYTKICCNGSAFRCYWPSIIYV